MKLSINSRVICAVRALFCVLIAASTISTQAADETIASRNAQVDGMQLHYLAAGHRQAVILLHGYAETSRMWRPIIPLLAKKFAIIAPDLPGIGDSAIPESGIDMLTSAKRVHALVRSLGIEKARVVGHDIGLMVAYAYAAQFPAETEKLALMDAFLPGVPGWEPIYNAPNIWHFRFHGEYPEALVKGRERTYFEYFWSITSRPIRLALFRKPIAKLIPWLTPDQDACARRGPISPPGRNWPKISRHSRRRS